MRLTLDTQYVTPEAGVDSMAGAGDVPLKQEGRRRSNRKWEEIRATGEKERRRWAATVAGAGRTAVSRGGDGVRRRRRKKLKFLFI